MAKTRRIEHSPTTLDNLTGFEKQVMQQALKVRNKLQNTSLNSFELRIEVTGRVHDGELKLKITLSPGSWNDHYPVHGFDLNDVLQEFCRRNGWDTTHAPLMISEHSPDEKYAVGHIGAEDGED